MVYDVHWEQALHKINGRKLLCNHNKMEMFGY